MCSLISGSSSVTAYLTPDVLKRPNLTIVTDAFVEKIIFSTNSETNPRAIGVQVAASIAAQKYHVGASKEVILCAGAISSPHLLFVSGDGSREELTSAGIPVIKNLPAVGKHLLNVKQLHLPIFLTFDHYYSTAYDIWPSHFPLQARCNG